MTEPYYSDEYVTLYHGDCRELWSGVLGDEMADAIVTDPPYGETNLGWDQWPDGWPYIAGLIADTVWCFGSMRMHLEHRDEFLESGWKFAQDIIWEKHNGSSLASDRFRRVHEIAIQWYRGPWAKQRHEVPTTPDATPWALRRRATKGDHQGSRGASDYVSEDGGPRLMRSVQYVRSTHGTAIRTTQKPLGILSPLIEYSVAPGGLVVDLFSGSGSVALASRQADRRCIAFEADEEAAEKSALRLSQTELFGALA